MENFKKYLTRYNLFGWPLASIAISILLVAFIIIPQVLDIKKNSDVISNIESRTKNLDSKAASLAEIDTKAYQDNLRVALVVLPEEKDIPSAIGQIQSLISDNKLQLNGMTFAHSDNPNSSSLQNYQIKIDVSGDQLSLKDFINSLKDAPLVMKVSDLEVSSNFKDNGLDSALTLTTYYQGQPQSLGDLEQPVSAINQADSDLLVRLQQRVQNLPLISTSVNLGPRGKADPFQ